MYEVKVSPSLLSLSQKKARELGCLKNSIEGGGGNVAGFLGEFIVAEELGIEVKNSYDYDLLLSNGLTADVKTKRTGYKPFPHYECSVAAFNTKQKCDYYIFTRIKNDFKIAWILGFYPKEKYFEDSTFHREGELDKSNSFYFKADCFNLPISKLKPIKKLI